MPESTPEISNDAPQLVENPHISFSELKEWTQCPFFHFLKRIQKVSTFNGNIFTTFGKAIHWVCETALLENDFDTRKLIFLSKFDEELALLSEKPSEKDIETFKSQADGIIRDIIPAMRAKFGNFEIVACEQALYEHISGYLRTHYDFKGFIDLVIRTEDGKIHICDYKSTSWGWDRNAKSNIITQYQLVLYKIFYAQKFGIDLKNIETHFILLKRTAKKDCVEFIRVTSAAKKQDNAMKLLKNALSNIDKHFYMKNKLSCARCEFKDKPEHCKR